jgi:hypothetical protein
MVVEHLTLMTTMSDYRQQFLDLKFRGRLSVADAVALEHCLGNTKAAAFVAEVDPWCYPHDETPATILVQSQVQSVVAQASHAGKNMKDFTDESITNFLLSPLLVKKVDRPSFVRKSKEQRGNPFSRMVVTAAATVARNVVDLPTTDQG